MSSESGPPDAPRTPGTAGPTRTSHDLSLRLSEGTRLADRYRLEALIGAGAMGLVYRARDEQLDVEVAVKVLRGEMAEDPRLLERFRRELVLARQVTHRNAVRIHDIGRDGDVVFLTMDYVPGQSLREVLDDGPLSPERAEEILRQLAGALGAAHEQGVVHRDIKPENVLLGDSGEAFLTDFGVARSLTSAGVTRVGAVVGTLDYLSPEQARGDEVDGRADLYSLGLLLFEVLSGELPFPSGTHEEVLASRLSGKPRSLRQAGVSVPPHLERVIERCLQRAPDHRYASASELLSDLDGPPIDSAAKTWLQRVALALALIALAGLSWWAVENRAPESVPDAGATVVAGRQAVAVLPLADETGRAEWAWMSDGVAEMLTNALAESPELRVVESSRVVDTVRGLRLSGDSIRPNDARQLAEVLSVDHLVSGSVRSLDPGVQVELALTGRSSGGVAESVQAVAQGARGLPALIKELTATLREALEVSPPITASVPSPDDPRVLRGLSVGAHFLARGDAVQARPALEEVVELAPDYAPGWLRLAQTYAALGLDEQAVGAAEQALAGFAGSESRMALEARALEARLGGDPEQAQEILRQLVEHFPNDGEARVALAEAYGDQGDLVAAREMLQAVVEDDSMHPRAWFLLGKYTIMAGDSRAAVDEHLVHALVVQNKLQNRQGQADVLNAMGVAYHRLDQLDEAAEHYARAARIRDEIGDQRGYATSLRNVAMVDTVRGRFDDAKKHLESARQILEQIGDRAGAAGLLTDLGVLAEERGDYQDALEAFRQALRINEEIGDRVAAAESYNNVGYAYYLLGEYDNAGIYWRQTADLYETVGDEAGDVQVTQNLGLVDLATGEWNRAAAAFLEALEGSRRLEMVVAEAVSLGALGELALLRGRFASARESIDGALALVTEIEDPRGIIEFNQLKVELELALGRQSEASSLLDDTENWLQESPNREQQVVTENLRGRLALASGQPQAAINSFEAARSLSGQYQSTAALEAALGVAQAHLASGRAQQAARMLAEVHDRVERLGNVPLILALEEALAEARLEIADPEAAVAVARRALDRIDASGGYGRTFRLHHLLARGLEQQQPGSGRAALAQAEAELNRLRSEVQQEYRESFAERREVRELDAAGQRLAGVG